MQKSLMQKNFHSEKSGQLVQKAEMQKAVLPSKFWNPKMQNIGQIKQKFHTFWLETEVLGLSQNALVKPKPTFLNF